MSTATVTSKGQITIPKDVRKALGLDEGTQVVFVFEGERAFLYPVLAGGIERLRQAARKEARFTSRDAERAAGQQAAVANALGRGHRTLNEG